MKFHRLTTLIVLTLAALVSAHAIELRFINWEGEESALKFTNKSKTVTIHSAESSLSSGYTYDGPGPLVLFKEVVIEGKIVRQPAATLDVPANLTHAILVLAASDESKTAYAGIWIDDTPESRPAGTVRLVNLSNHAVAFNVDGAEFSIAPTANHQVPVRSNVRRVLMQAATQVGGKWEIVANNPLPMRNGLRVLIVLRDGRPQEGSEINIVDLLSFYDKPPALPGEKIAAAGR